MSAVPVIDIAAFLSGSPAKQSVAEAVDVACREVGFLVVEGHGVTQDLLTRMTESMLGFFKQPPLLKGRCGVTSDNFHGYRGPNATALAKSKGVETPPDLMERFTIGRVDVPDDEYHRSRHERIVRANQWPEQLPGFLETAEKYYREMERLASDLMRVFAVSLKLPEDYFAGFFDKHISQQVTNYYPPVETPPEPGQLRAGAHTDYGSLTILYPAVSAGGLQVMNSSGTWEDVPVVPGSFIINIGDLLARWTNDRWVSTLHRVVNPEGIESKDARMSIVFFQQPNDDAIIRCIETCVGVENPPKYGAVGAGEHVAAKLNRAWVGKRALESTS
jgi:isopenicillin N synthase-like dioxygenase